MQQRRKSVGWVERSDTHQYTNFFELDFSKFYILTFPCYGVKMYLHTIKGGKGMQDKRVTIRIPFEIWKALRELQTVGKISSIQQAAVTGMNKLIESLKWGEEDNQRGAAKKRVLDVLVKEKPLGNWEDIHRERTEADVDRS
jgi:hypothetical protein